MQKVDVRRSIWTSSARLWSAVLDRVLRTVRVAAHINTYMYNVDLVLSQGNAWTCVWLFINIDRHVLFLLLTVILRHCTIENNCFYGTVKFIFSKNIYAFYLFIEIATELEGLKS